MSPRMVASTSWSTAFSQLPKGTSICNRCLERAASKSFSTTPKVATRQRRSMFRWLNGPGAVFKNSLPGSTNYLSAYDSSGNLLRGSERKPRTGQSDVDLVTLPGEEGVEDGDQNIASEVPVAKETVDDLMPFPLNRQFRSQPVLSEEFTEEIWKRVMEKGQSVRVVSATLGVEMGRVGAVVRLKSVEKEWMKQGKTLATTYARAMLSMLPKTPFEPDQRHQPTHESINDLPVHRDTLPQIFHPVSESRHFTRVDAGKVFNPTLLPADDRIPHPELVLLMKDELAGMVGPERLARQRERNAAEQREREERAKARKEKEARELTKVAPSQSRWEFHFKDIRVESVGRDGRDKRGIGARYGIPYQDRKRGQVKIPTRVE